MLEPSVQMKPPDAAESSKPIQQPVWSKCIATKVTEVQEGKGGDAIQRAGNRSRCPELESKGLPHRSRRRQPSRRPS